MLRKLARGVFYLTGAITLSLAVLLGWLWLSAYRALPVHDGFVAAKGLSAPVTVVRDAHGIPTITAASEGDAYFALGYVHAQDRMFQMELMRRQGQGRLSELIGAAGLSPDRMMRTLGVYRRAEEDLRNFDSATRAAFDSYTAGVNAWLEEGHPLPLEYKLLWFKPEPWKPADSLVWQKLMGLSLSGNWDDELVNAAIIAKLGPEKAAALSPGVRPEDPVTMASLAPVLRELPSKALHAAMTAVVQPTEASNVWAVAGTRTQTGSPIIANDPHLGFQAPSIWYFAGIRTPGFELFGATVPGVPLHMIAQNGNLAWGITTTHSDTSDLFIEKLGADGRTYETPEGPRAFAERLETINVRFGEPVTLTVRETRHGPVVSDVLRRPPGMNDLIPEPYVVALSAALLAPEDRTAEGVYYMNHAKDRTEFLEAIRRFHAPHQNMMFADRTGAVGYYAPGRVPMRKAGNGLVPVPGWDGSHDWTGWVPFEELPRVIGPAAEVIINANNKMVGDSYAHLLAAQWPDSYRAMRIADVLATETTVSMDTTATLQLDIVSVMAREMLPLMVARATPRSPQEREFFDRMKAWDGTTDARRLEPLMFAVWIERLKTHLLADDLSDMMRFFGGVRPELMRTILTTDTQWCDDIATPETETCETQVSAAWSETVDWLLSQGPDPTALQWGAFHRATFDHLLFGNFPVVTALGRLRVPTGGDGFTVNRGSFSASSSARPFRHFHGASLRAIYDLNDLSQSRFALAGGQSGHLLSKDYGSLLGPWSEGQYFTPPRETDGTRRMTLQPGQ
ncbi:MAG: penicillin acylase family protein [Rhodospirillaceae bacterium]